MSSCSPMMSSDLMIFLADLRVVSPIWNSTPAPANRRLRRGVKSKGRASALCTLATGAESRDVTWRTTLLRNAFYLLSAAACVGLPVIDGAISAAATSWTREFPSSCSGTASGPAGRGSWSGGLGPSTGLGHLAGRRDVAAFLCKP
jgi:hypothetical protein